MKQGVFSVIDQNYPYKFSNYLSTKLSIYMDTMDTMDEQLSGPPLGIGQVGIGIGQVGTDIDQVSTCLGEPSLKERRRLTITFVGICSTFFSSFLSFETRYSVIFYNDCMVP